MSVISAVVASLKACTEDPKPMTVAFPVISFYRNVSCRFYAFFYFFQPLMNVKTILSLQVVKNR